MRRRPRPSRAAVRDGHLVFGPDLPAFETALARAVGAEDALAVTTGTAALHLGLLVAGVRPGDEVWVSDLTFIASLNAATYCGARVTLVDSEPRSWNLDPDVVVTEITRRARAGEAMPGAIVPVHLLGHPADLAPILAAAAEHGIPIVEDAAEALGSRWVGGELDGCAPGAVGDVGIYSFNFNKPISTGGGGMLVARDPAALARARHLGAQAKIPDTDYRHDAVGYNYRLSNLAAALGVVQMGRLPGLIERRRAIAERYRDAFAPLGLGAGPDEPWARRSGWLSTIVLPEQGARRAVRDALARGRHRDATHLAADAHPGSLPGPARARGRRRGRHRRDRALPALLRAPGRRGPGRDHRDRARRRAPRMRSRC